MLYLLLVTTAVLPVLTLCSEECTLHQLQSCLESLQSVTQGNDLAFVTTRIELEAVCSICYTHTRSGVARLLGIPPNCSAVRCSSKSTCTTDICCKLKDSVLCVDEHMKNCFTATQRKVFNHVVAGARQFLAELCVYGPIQDAYLRHAPCYRNVSLLDDKCALKYKHLVKLSESVDEQKNVDEGLRESCCAFNDFVLCKYIFVTKDCGQDAADFLQQHLDKISSPLLQEHCAHYTYASDACTQSDAVRIFVTSWCLSVTTVLTLVKYIQTITNL